ncbi:hypothetical protein CDAR_429461 [Caerostris darwini]|uniref:Uncharacterized protein n=1 Tax=Caerostris darwini TaxID=1538125 RepID=A0AAV4WHL6_9ARAC|nr:hypothetical protein CDAR_429461 [Caerostris darwini]
MIRFEISFARHNGVWQHTKCGACHRRKRVFSGVDLPAENNPRNDGIRTQRNKGRNLHSLRSRIVYVRSVSVNCVIWRTTPTVERRIVPEREVNLSCRPPSPSLQTYSFFFYSFIFVSIVNGTIHKEIENRLRGFWKQHPVKCGKKLHFRNSVVRFFICQKS